jgi:hypothetical protein
MAKSKATTVAEYLSELSEDRRKAIQSVRKVIRKSLPKGIRETMSWGMIAYEIPLKIHPKTYNGKPLLYAALGSQKNYMVLHSPSVYVDKKTEMKFRRQVKADGKKLDLGGGCIRFKKVDDLSLSAVADLIGTMTVKGYIEMFEKGRGKKK